MRNRIERLRLWLLAGAGLLVIVLGMFIGSARYLMRHTRLGKLANLAADIKGSSMDWTYSHTSQGGTEYTIHAAREVAYKDGKIALHDVSMTLYGQKHDRADRIYGDEFEYDKDAGVVRAVGVVHIDMQAADAGRLTGDRAKEKTERPEGSGAKVLHATTSGLVYLEKLGVAATSEKIDFQLGAMTGHAVGADYNTDSGLLVLHSAVEMNAVEQGKPVTMTASSAELDKQDQRTRLTHARYVSLGTVAAADDAILTTREDGSIARIEAQGNVSGAMDGARMMSARADVLLNAESKPQTAMMSGGVGYENDEALRQVRGQAAGSTIVFDAQGQPTHAVFTDAVHLIERTRATEAGKEPWSVDELTAAKVEVALVAAVGGTARLRDAQATGAAHLTIVNNGTLRSARGREETEVSADDLKAHFVDAPAGKSAPQIETAAGRGHTVLRNVSADALEQTSSGDVIDARFRTGPTVADVAHGPGKAQGMDRLLSATQDGHVEVTRRVPPRDGARGAPTVHVAEDVEHATAQHAVYDGDADRLMLTGNVQLMDAGSMLWANQIGLDHQTGDARAEGAVKVDYVQVGTADAAGLPGSKDAQRSGTAEPTHILAERAELQHATQVATFYGAASRAGADVGKPVRMWQGGSQVQAAVLEFARMQSRFTARGNGSAEGDAQVHTVLLTTGGGGGLSKAGKSKSDKGTGAGRSTEAVRIASRELVYSQALRTAEFTGGVRVDGVDGTMLANEATAYLTADGGLQQAATESQSALATAGLELDGPVERIIGTGHVQVVQPGRRASGERLVYTASDRSFVLNGDAAAPAKVVDVQGTSTAAAFRFHAADESVETLSQIPSEGGKQRTRTESHVSKAASLPKVKR